MTSNGSERHINKQGLERLLKAADAMDSATASERASFGDKLTKAEQDEHLDKWCFRIVRQLNKLDPAKAAFRIRALNLYIDLLGLAAQADLEDVVAQAEADSLSADDKKVVTDILANGGRAALKKFENQIGQEDDPKKVQRELDKKLAEWPELTEQLDVIAEARLKDLRVVTPLKAVK